MKELRKVSDLRGVFSTQVGLLVPEKKGFGCLHEASGQGSEARWRRWAKRSRERGSSGTAPARWTTTPGRWRSLSSETEGDGEAAEGRAAGRSSAALRAGSAPRGCRSRCSPRSRWPSSGGPTRRAWQPSGACGPPGAASSPASAPGSAARGPSPASLALEEGPFAPDQSRRFRTLHSFSGQAWERLG